MSNIAALAQLFTRSRDGIDKNLAAIREYLESTGLGYRDKLVDDQGFPLPGIEHQTILAERQRASRLINDRARVQHILDLLASAQYSTDGTGTSLLSDIAKLRPFAVIEEVHQNSPADEAKLLNADFLVRFGAATQLQDVPKQIIEGVRIPVTVLRVDKNGNHILDLEITPAKWEGNGLVGAHLAPL